MDLQIYKLIDEKIFIRGEKIKINEYLDEVIKYYEQILKDDIKCNVIITMDKERIEAILLVVLAIESFINNLKNSSKTILDTLKPGQIVIYNNKGIQKKVRFEDKGKFYGKEKLILVYEDKTNSRAMINLEDAYKLSIYDGKSSKLSSMNGNKNTSKYSGKFLFGKLVGMNIEEFTGIIEEQIIVTFPSKYYMNELISSIKIEIENIKYDFTQVFPCKYYSSLNSGEDLKGNKIKSKELFLFTSRLDISKELFRTNKECTNLMLLGESTYRNYIGGIFDNLLSKKRLNKIFIHNTYDSINCIEEVLDRDINIYSWGSQILNQKFSNKDKLIERYINSSTNNIVIEDNTLNKAFLDTRKSLISILKTNEDLIDKDKFTRLGFSLFNLLQRIAIPLKVYEQYHTQEDYFEKQFIMLQEILEKNRYYITNTILIKSVIENLKILCDLIYYKNPKIDILKSCVKNNSIIICSDEIEKEYLKEEKGVNEAEIITIREFKKNNYSNGELIYTTFYNNLSINQLPYAHRNNIQNILYYTDVIKYNSRIKYLNISISNISNMNQVEGTKTCENIEIIRYNKSIFDVSKAEINNSDDQIYIDEEVNETLISNYIKKCVDENSIDWDIEELLDTELERRTYSYGDYNIAETNDIKKIIIFEDGRYSYITRAFKPLCIDSNENTVIKNIEELQKGDRIVFINEKSDDDLFDLFHKIVNSKIFRSRYSKDYENMKYWKLILKDYIDKYDGDYDLVSQELKIYGLDKFDISIRQWINDEKIIGPREKEVYQAIGKVTMDNKLLHEWQEIYESCNTIRSFRTKFKKTFKDMVKMSVIDKLEGRDELEVLVIEVFGDLKEYADIVTILDIENTVEDSSTIKTNCLLFKRQFA